MAVGVVSRFPEGAGAEDYDAVNEKLDAANNPIEGLIFHCAGELEGRFQVFSVFETAEQHDRFVQERLIPAQVAAFGQETVDQMPAAEIVQSELHSYVIP